MPGVERQRQAALLLERRLELAGWVAARLAERRPERASQPEADRRGRYEDDAAQQMLYLAEAVRHNTPELFREYACWARDLLESAGTDRTELIAQLEALRDGIRKELGLPDDAFLLQFLAEGIQAAFSGATAPTCLIDPDAPHGALARAYLDALLAGDRQEALALVADAADRGLGLQALYLDVFQPVQREVGRLWQTNAISVPVEHFCTAATQLAMAQLYPRALETPRTGGTVVAVGVGGDLHEMGIRMVSDLLEHDGWRSVFLGTNVPSAEVSSVLIDQNASLLAVSVTLSSLLSEAAALIDKVRAHQRSAQIGVLVGGPPFLASPELASRIGADATAPDAWATVEAARRWKPGA